MINESKGGTREKYEMMQIITTLTKKIDTLEKTVTELKANVRKRYTKKSTLKALNDMHTGLVPFVNFSGFMTELAKTTMDFETMESQDVSIHSLFVRAVNDTCMELERRYTSEQTEYVNTHLPVISFSQHKNVLFVYGNESSNEWEAMETATYQRMIQSVHMYLMSRCSLWRETYLPARDLVTDQDMGMSAYLYRRSASPDLGSGRGSLASEKKPKVSKPTSNREPLTDAVMLRQNVSMRTDNAKKYQKVMDKICNVNTASAIFQCKLKTELCHLFSESDLSVEYFAKYLEKGGVGDGS
jgi:hypothetical protein